MGEISLSSAFSIATLYSDNYPLSMEPGEVKDTFFLLRNVAEGDSDVRVSVEMSGENVGSLTDKDKIYNVPFGQEVEVPVRIVMPADAKGGKIYYIKAIFRPLAEDTGSGDIQFLVNIGKSFPVVVKEDEKELLSTRKPGSLTIEEDIGLVQTFAPIFREGNVVWLFLLAFIVTGIAIVLILLVYLVVKDRGPRTVIVQYPQQAQYQGAQPPGRAY